MKSVALIAALIAATAAWAGPMVVWQDSSVRPYWPREIAWPDGRVTISPNVEQCIQAGARWETEAEWTGREAAEAQAAQEAAEQAALYADPEPSVFVPRIETDMTNVVGTSQILVDGLTGDVIAVDDTGSPKHTYLQKQAQINSNAMTYALWKASVRELKASIATNRADERAISALTNGFTAAQCRSTVNDLRRELIDLSADVADLRRRLAALGKMTED